MKVHIVGDILVKGRGFGKPTYGNGCILKSDANIDTQINDGDILIVKKLEDEHEPFLKRLNGVIVEENAITSGIVANCISRGIPIIVGAEGATTIIRTGTLVTMNTGNGTVYSGKTNVQ
jgi:pyruvate kinase